MLYHELPNEKRWLQGDNPWYIGGRGTDIFQIPLSLEALIKGYFPINGIPQEIIERLNDLKMRALSLEADIQAFIILVNENV